MEMSEDSCEHDDLPLFCRIFLFFPKLSLENFSERFQGIFYVVILPMFIFIDAIMNLAFLACFSFPINFIAVVAANSFVVLLILRIYLDRAITFHSNLMKEQHFCWNLDKSLNEYFKILKSEDDVRNRNKTS